MDPGKLLRVSNKCRVLKIKAVVLVVAAVDKTLKAADCNTPQCKSKCITKNQSSFGLSHK